MKPWAPPIDLADHDVVEEDCDLVVGPLTARLAVNSSGGGRQLAGVSSFKDTSILGSTALSSKLASSSSAPAPSTLARRLSLKQGSNGVYSEGTPIIAAASPPSRPVSALLQARMSAPCGSSGSTVDASAQLRSANGACLSDRVGTEPFDASLDSRVQGDIQGGDSDDSTPPNSTGLWRKRRDNGKDSGNSGRQAAGATVKPHATGNRALATGQLAGSADAPADPAKAEPGRALNVPTTVPKSSLAAGVLPRRASCEGAAVGGSRSAALPCVDVQSDRRQRPPRSADAVDSEGQAATVAVQPKSSSTGPGRAAAASSSPAPSGALASSSRSNSDESGGGGHAAALMAPKTGPGPFVAADPSPSPATASVDRAEKPASALQRSPSGRFLSRLLTGSHVSPAGPKQERPQEARPTGWTGSSDGATGEEGTGKDGGSSLRSLFSRPPSARRKSEVSGGASASVLQQQSSLSSRQLRHSHHGQTDEAAEEVAAAASIGGIRQPSGLFKRTASAIAAAWAR